MTIPIVYPAPQVERYTLTGTGSITLTEEQRTARILAVVVEKVKFGSQSSYFNFSTPEPESHWGYVQWVQRDFIVETRQLQYRREVLKRVDNSLTQQYLDLKCLVTALGDLLICTSNALANGIPDFNPLDPEGGNAIADCVPSWSDETLRNAVVKTEPDTALWYEINPGWGAQITIEWSAYAGLCQAPEELQPAPPPKVPGAGESGGGASGGGGNRNAPPPPPARETDPLADSPAPPPDVPGGPDTPQPGSSGVRVRVIGQVINGQNLGCNVLEPVDDLLIINGSNFSSNAADYSVTLDGSFNPGGCVGARFGYTVRYLGQPIGGAGPAGFYDAPTVQSVELF